MGKKRHSIQGKTLTISLSHSDLPSTTPAINPPRNTPSSYRKPSAPKADPQSQTALPGQLTPTTTPFHHNMISIRTLRITFPAIPFPKIYTTYSTLPTPSPTPYIITIQQIHVLVMAPPPYTIPIRNAISKSKSKKKKKTTKPKRNKKNETSVL